MSFISISKAAKFLNVSPDTLRNWEKQGRVKPVRTPGGARRYNLSELEPIKSELSLLPQKPRGLISISKAAASLHVSTNTLRSWDKKGLVSAERTKGGARRYTRAEISRIKKELGVEQLPRAESNEIEKTNILKNQGSPHKSEIKITKIFQNFLLISLSILFVVELSIYGLNSNFIKSQVSIIFPNLDLLVNGVTDKSKEYFSNTTNNLVKTYNFIAQSYYNFYIFDVELFSGIYRSIPELPNRLALSINSSKVLGIFTSNTKLIHMSGSGKIVEGAKSVEIINQYIASESKIFITPTSQSDKILSVSKKTQEQKFIVSIPTESDIDITFDWLIVND